MLSSSCRACIGPACTRQPWRLACWAGLLLLRGLRPLLDQCSGKQSEPAFEARARSNCRPTSPVYYRSQPDNPGD